MASLEVDDYYDLPTDLKEEVAQAKGRPLYEAISKKMKCNDHDRVLYQASNNYGYVCQNCWEKVGDDWIPHDQLSEEQKREAYDSEEVERKRENRKSLIAGALEEEYIQKAEEILSDEVSTPAADADAESWAICFESVSEHDWQAVYEAYLESEAWEERREACFEIKGRTCTAALKGCQESADHAHHASYQNVGREPVFDLEPVCESCHDKLHNLHRLPDE